MTGDADTVSDDRADVALVARELYAVVPAQFVAARKARTAQLRTVGDREAARAVAALPKASASAWAVSAVVRERPAEVDALRQLGAELRVAQASGNAGELRDLSRRRRALTDRVAATAARLAEEHGVALSAAALDQVAATWHAVVIDRTAERAVRSGLLVRPLQPGAVDLPTALAPPGVSGQIDDDGGSASGGAGVGDEGEGTAGGAGVRAAAGKKRGLIEQSRTKAERTERERSEAEQAERERAEAERVAAEREAAEHAVVTARQEVAVTAAALARAQAEVLRAAAQVEEARRELTEREDLLAELDERQDTAHETHDEAEAHLVAAERTLARLTRDAGHPPSRSLTAGTP